MRTLSTLSTLLLATSLLALGACGDDSPGGADASIDASADIDAPLFDASAPDAAAPDAAAPEAAAPDAAAPDAAAPDASGPDAPPAEVSPLIGTYLLTRLDGELPAPDDPVQTWTFDQSVFHVSLGGQFELEGTYTFDTSTEPKQLDLVAEGDTVPCIYRFSEDGNILTIKGPQQNTGPRPTNFDVEPKTTELLELTRQP